MDVMLQTKFGTGLQVELTGKWEPWHTAVARLPAVPKAALAKKDKGPEDKVPEEWAQDPKMWCAELVR